MAQITADGIIARSVQQHADDLQDEFRTALGVADINFDVETPQGQLVNVLASRDARIDQEAVDLFNSASLSAAAGVHLDALVGLFGVFRLPARASTATVTFTGAAGTNIAQGTRLRSADSDIFETTSAAAIAAGETTVDVPVASIETGPIGVVAASINELVTGVPGITGVTNAADGAIGRSTETDTQMRNRFTFARARNSLGSTDSIRAGVLDVAGVQHCVVRDNPTASQITIGVTNVPAYSVLVVVEGGEDDAVGSAILRRKPAGTPTTGAVETSVSTIAGVTETVRFTRVTPLPLACALQLNTTAAYPQSNTPAIIRALSAYVGELAPGESLDTQRAQAAVLAFDHFSITSLVFTVKQGGGAIPSTVDITNRLTLALTDVTVST